MQPDMSAPTCFFAGEVRKVESPNRDGDEVLTPTARVGSLMGRRGERKRHYRRLGRARREPIGSASYVVRDCSEGTTSVLRCAWVSGSTEVMTVPTMPRVSSTLYTLRSSESACSGERPRIAGSFEAFG